MLFLDQTGETVLFLDQTGETVLFLDQTGERTTTLWSTARIFNCSKKELKQPGITSQVIGMSSE